MTDSREVTSFRRPLLRARNAPQSNVESSTPAPVVPSGSSNDTVYRFVSVSHTTMILNHYADFVRLYRSGPPHGVRAKVAMFNQIR